MAQKHHDDPAVVPAAAPAPHVGPVASTIDYGMFTTQAVIETYIKRYPVPALIRDMFFSQKDYSDTDVVRIDSKLGGRGLAPFILPLENQVVGRRRPFKETYIPAPVMAPARVITPRELRGPLMGETPFNYKSPEERFASIVAEDGQDMDDEIARTEEWMCCQCMFQGRIPINYRNRTSIVIDYGFTNITALATPWTDPTSNPLDDLTAVQGAMNANGYGGNVAIYSPSAWTALWKNPNVKDSMKNTFPTFIPITGLPTGEIPPSGAQRGPSFASPTMENWIYHATYTKSNPADPSGTIAVPYVPNGCVLIGSSDVKNRIVYGLVIQMEEDGQFHSYQLDRVPKIESNVNKNLYMQTVTSRPVPVPIDLLSWSVITGAA
jgi:hypothetical protein